ncbi:MAG: Bcr/CflA family drug resistance efflux transporter [Proteobacteria bacterium]|nr:MAG: Bcr/CflA family drug resistance efflux transporter [Pseudomonadota bacterium]
MLCGMAATSKKKRGIPGWLILVGSMTALGPVSIDMYLPGFPLIERQLGQSGVESTMAAFLIGLAAGQLFYGPVSDRFGRKPPLYVGFVLYILGSLGCALAASMPMLVAMRTTQALGACASLVIGRAVVRDRCEPHEAARAFTTLMLIVALGPVLAPLLGGAVVTWLGWRAVFVFQALLGLVLLGAMHWVLTESRDPAHVVPLRLGRVLASYAGLLRDRSFLGYSLISGCGMGALFCYVTGAPIVLTNLYGVTPQEFGLLIALNGLAFMTASRANIVALRRRGPGEILQRAIWQPTVVSATLLGANLLFDVPLWLVVVLQFAFFISVARLNPNVATLALVRHGHQAGNASALMGALQSLVSTLGGVAVAAFTDGTFGPLALMMTAGAAASWALYGWVAARGA